uniref:hypothetical protein n=1 Tax=uncultured Ruminococcus sp. TaxID=165186 RepID=UPI00345D1092
MSWSEFVSSIREPELIQYLKERRLYVNEMVAESEEMEMSPEDYLAELNRLILPMPSLQFVL